MILGVRFRGHAVPREVLSVIGKYADRVSFQPYDAIAPWEWLEGSYELHQKPILITEFSFKAKDSGLPNTVGAGFACKSQDVRAYQLQKGRTSVYVLWYEPSFSSSLGPQSSILHSDTKGVLT